MKKKTPPAVPNTYTSPLQTQATQVSEEERNRGNQSLEAARDAYSNFMPGGTGSSNYRKFLGAGLAGKNASINENALARSRERGQMAGFGVNQPITYGAENQLGQENANRLAQIPLQVEEMARPAEMQAIQGIQGIGQAQLGQGAGYFGQATGLEDERLQEFYRQQEEARKRKAGIWGSLAKIGLGVGSAFVPGLGALSGGQ